MRDECAGTSDQLSPLRRRGLEDPRTREVEAVQQWPMFGVGHHDLTIRSPDVRGQGVGRALSQETFALALSMGLEKLLVQMTVDQTGAIAIFEGLGFKAEALLRDHVKDKAGKKHDIVVLGHNVAQVRAQMEAYGLPGAVQQ